MRILTLLAAVLALTSATASAALAAGPVRTERLEAELVPMSAWAAPGSTVIVAVRHEIAEGWHTYWRNPGDSGGATELDWTLPPGFEAGDILWPLPERQPIADLMNYGYSGEVYLPVPVSVPADARPGSTLSLRVHAAFLVCSDEMCVPEDAELALDLPVREGAAPLAGAHGRTLEEIVAAAPRPAGIEATIYGEGGAWRLSAVGDVLTGVSIDRAWFFPFEGGVIAHAAPQPGERGSRGLTLSLPAGSTPPGDQLAGVLATSAGAWEIVARPGPPLAGASGEGDLGIGAEVGGLSAATVLKAVLFALIGGLILNLMPCVFPVLSMKAAALADAAHDPRLARREGLAFLAGVMTTFLLLAGTLIALRAGGQAVGWGFQLQSPPVIAGLGLLMLAVALNLSGVYHMGGALQGVGGRLAGAPGGSGAFFVGVLAVVVAAPCTAPFMAFAMGVALTFPAPLTLMVFAALGLGLALPFVLLSLSPRLLRRLPRPGPWMDRLKGLLAFPMYGAALWLAWVFSRQVGGPGLALLFGAGLALALAAWLWGRRQADGSRGGAGRWTLVAAVMALALAFVLAVAAARSGEPTASGPDGPGQIAATAWSPGALDQARAAGRPVFVNFTADWCVTCKLNERAALNGRRAAEAFQRTGTTYMVADWTLRDEAIARELTRHGRSGVPLYLVYGSGQAAPAVLPQLLTEGVVVEALEQAAAQEPG